ncbi:MAG TPA: aminotransferase class I/II-fold pyridoxal phosphate-dependent enzyme [Dongiaceae bacterium]
MSDSNWQPSTLAAQGLGWIDDATKAVSPPIHMSSTHLRDPDNQYRNGRDYIRDDNPSFDQAEALLAKLENGKKALLLSSGMAAATAVFLALRPGDHVIAARNMYWSLRRWLSTYATAWGLQVEFVDMTDLDAFRALIRPGQTKLVWIETPSNPLWTITDIAAVAEIAHKAGAKVTADSTVATPVLSQPLTLGADIVMHSATKYLNGHSDICAGALVTNNIDNAFWQGVAGNRGTLGGIIGSFEAWLLLRGMRSLFPRVERACASAQKLAEGLRRHRWVESVLYPGLSDFPGHALAAKQMKGGFSGMLSIRVKGGEGGAIRTAAAVEIWKRATSLGGTESLIEHRASIEGEGSPVPMDLLRLSVGLENAEDLLADLSNALETAHRN